MKGKVSLKQIVSVLNRKEEYKKKRKYLQSPISERTDIVRTLALCRRSFFRVVGSFFRRVPNTSFSRLGLCGTRSCEMAFCSAVAAKSFFLSLILFSLEKLSRGVEDFTKVFCIWFIIVVRGVIWGTGGLSGRGGRRFIIFVLVLIFSGLIAIGVRFAGIQGRWFLVVRGGLFLVFLLGFSPWYIDLS